MLSSKNAVLKPVLVAGFVLLLQQKALAYSAEATDELFKNIVLFGFFGIFVIVTIIMVMFQSKDSRGAEGNAGKLLLKSLGISVLVFIILSIMALAVLGQL